MHDANTHQEDADESRVRYHSTHSEANTKDRHHTRGHPRLSRGARGDVATLRTLRRALEKPERADEVCEEPGRSRGTVLVARDGAPVTSTIWPRPPRRKEPLRPLCPAVRQAAGRAWQVVATEEPSVMSGSLLRPAPSAGLRPPSAHGLCSLLIPEWPRSDHLDGCPPPGSRLRPGPGRQRSPRCRCQAGSLFLYPGAAPPSHR